MQYQSSSDEENADNIIAMDYLCADLSDSDSDSDSETSTVETSLKEDSEEEDGVGEASKGEDSAGEVSEDIVMEDVQAGPQKDVHMMEMPERARQSIRPCPHLRGRPESGDW